MEIATVKNNKEKSLTYKSEIERYNKSINSGFYYEATLINYAILEDRVNAFLYYLDIVNRFPDGNIRFYFNQNRDIFDIYGRYEDEEISSNTYTKKKSNYFSKISNKIRLLRSIIEWYIYAVKSDLTICEQLLLKKLIILDVDKLLTTFNELLEWCNYRNQIVHNLMYKKVTIIEKDLPIYLDKSYNNIRFLDLQISKLKRKRN